MITKTIHSDSFDFGMPSCSLINDGGRLFDLNTLEKRAAMFDRDLDTLEKKPGYAYVHLITTGAVDRYGNNNNGDGFNKEASLHRPPKPASQSVAAIMLDGGLKKYHNDTYQKYASVYKNHKNKHKGGTPLGYIAKAAYNDGMDRGELIVGLKMDEWGKELEKLASDKPVYWSQACDVKYEICSYCGARDSRLRDRCDHLKNDLMTITKEGHQIYAINDAPHFHDISGVVKPADKIAFALRKVASSDVISSAELAALEGILPNPDIARKFLHKRANSKFELLRKLAAIEKEIMLSPSSSPIKSLISAFEGGSGFGEVDDSACRRLSSFDPGELFGALKNKKIVLPLDLFLKLVLGSKYNEVSNYVPSAEAALPTLFQDMMSAPNMSDILEDNSYEPMSCFNRGMMPDVMSLLGGHSLDMEPVKTRIIRVTIKPKKMQKKACLIKTATGNLLAMEYGKYLLSFADGLANDKLNLTVAQKFANLI